MITEKLLVKTGYKPFKKPDIFRTTATSFHQKCIKYKSSKLYFINVFGYANNLAGYKNVFECEAQFRKGRTYVNMLVLYDPKNTIKNVEALFNKMYNLMEFEPYEK